MGRAVIFVLLSDLLQSVPVALWTFIYGQPKKIPWLLLVGKNLNMLFLSKKPLTTLITMTWSFPAEALARILPSRHRDFFRLKLLIISNVLCQKFKINQTLFTIQGK